MGDTYEREFLGGRESRMFGGSDPLGTRPRKYGAAEKEVRGNGARPDDPARSSRWSAPCEPTRAADRMVHEDIAVPLPAPVASTTQPFLAGRGLVKRYGARNALRHVDFAVRSGEVVAVVGPSGAGKTTLLQVMADLLRPDEGAVMLDGHRVDRLDEARRRELRRSEFGFVAQGGALLSELSVEENVALPLMLRGAIREQALASAREWLCRLGMHGWQRSLPRGSSAGRVPRVAIARALVHQPKVVFADEPTGGLEARTSSEVWEALLRAAADSSAAVVVATQDRELAARADRIVQIRGGTFVAGAMTG